MTLVVVLSYLLAAALLVVGIEVEASSSWPPVPSAATALPGCPSKCGDVVIPYPFGIGPKCALASNFTVICNQSIQPPRPYIEGIHEIVNISLDAGEARTFAANYASDCYTSQDIGVRSDVYGVFIDPFRISPTRNIFIFVGCNGLPFLEAPKALTGNTPYLTSCITSCDSLEDAAQDNDPCYGIGCCQTSLPPNLDTIIISWSNTSENPLWEVSPCSYAFVAEIDWYNFSQQDLRGHSFSRRVDGGRTIPLVLDWAIRNGSCPSTPELTAPACVSRNSTCVSVAVTQGGGYRCICSPGYQGNPYLPDGCTNIDECMLRKMDPKTYETKYNCSSGTICRDTPGHYECVCKLGHIGDPKSERGCRPIFPGYATAIVVTVVFILVSALLLCVLVKEHKQRVRRGFFNRNGGEILKGMDIRIFTKVELDKMTNRYSNSIGKGHFGEVFMGTTDDKQRVAVKRKIPQPAGKKKNHLFIKKGKTKNQDGRKEFIDEIKFQFRMKHPNLVRLIGCCLEMNVPSLVFEYIPRGSLYDALHGADIMSLPLTKRLDIAIGSAEAVSYMHSHDDHKHVHGDIKSANILLDGDLSPKVSDFGSSKLLSIDMYAKAVKADGSYIDPLYMKTDRFTAKCDVYSFGVVLLELITRKTARYDGNNSLPVNFIRCCKAEGNNGRQMYDTDILLMNNGGDAQLYIECLDKIGQLAVRCLNADDEDERPTMAEVVEELKQVKSMLPTGGSAGGSETAYYKQEDEAANNQGAAHDGHTIII